MHKNWTSPNIRATLVQYSCMLLFVYMVHVMFVHMWLHNKRLDKDVLKDDQSETHGIDATTWWQRCNMSIHP